jgi:hypothetical protein
MSCGNEQVQHDGGHQRSSPAHTTRSSRSTAACRPVRSAQVFAADGSVRARRRGASQASKKRRTRRSPESSWWTPTSSPAVFAALTPNTVPDLPRRVGGAALGCCVIRAVLGRTTGSEPMAPMPPATPADSGRTGPDILTSRHRFPAQTPRGPGQHPAGPWSGSSRPFAHKSVMSGFDVFLR